MTLKDGRDFYVEKEVEKCVEAAAVVGRDSDHLSGTGDPAPVGRRCAGNWGHCTEGLLESTAADVRSLEGRDVEERTPDLALAVNQRCGFVECLRP